MEETIKDVRLRISVIIHPRDLHYLAEFTRPYLKFLSRSDVKTSYEGNPQEISRREVVLTDPDRNDKNPDNFVNYLVMDYGEDNIHLGFRKFTGAEVKNLMDIVKKCSLDKILSSCSR